VIGEVGAFNSEIFRVKVKSAEYVFCSHSNGEIVRVSGFECFDRGVGDAAPVRSYAVLAVAAVLGWAGASGCGLPGPSSVAGFTELPTFPTCRALSHTARTGGLSRNR